MFLTVAYPKYFNLDYELIEENLIEKIYKIPKREYGFEILEGGYILEYNTQILENTTQELDLENIIKDLVTENSKV